MIADLGFQLLDLISTASLRPSYIVSKMAGFETIKIQRIGHWICVFCMISFWLYRASQVFRVWRWPLKYLGLPLEGHPRWSWPILFFSMFRFWFTNCKLIWNEGAHFCHLAFGECCFYSTRQKKKITLFYWVFLANISWGSYVTHSSFFLFFSNCFYDWKAKRQPKVLILSWKFHLLEILFLRNKRHLEERRQMELLSVSDISPVV